MIPFLPIFSLLLLVVVNSANANGHYDKILAHSRIRGRDQGPNVCALQQILGTKKKYFSTCRNWYQGAICGKKTERQSMNGGGAEREGDTESETGSRL
uniref:Periostin n=1 Tax=Felis catus TaxID=9685 RepID=A0ABI7ZLT2_FELCA